MSSVFFLREQARGGTFSGGKGHSKKRRLISVKCSLASLSKITSVGRLIDGRDKLIDDGLLSDRAGHL